MKRKIGDNVHIFHLFDIERRYIERCWFFFGWKYGSGEYIKV